MYFSHVHFVGCKPCVLFGPSQRTEDDRIICSLKRYEDFGTATDWFLGQQGQAETKGPEGDIVSVTEMMVGD